MLSLWVLPGILFLGSFLANPRQFGFVLQVVLYFPSCFHFLDYASSFAKTGDKICRYLTNAEKHLFIMTSQYFLQIVIEVFRFLSISVVSFEPKKGSASRLGI